MNTKKVAFSLVNYNKLKRSFFFLLLCIMCSFLMIFKSFVKVQMKTTPTKEGEKKRERERKEQYMNKVVFSFN
jgi:hypothetical protein